MFNMWQKFPVWSDTKSTDRCTACPKSFIWGRAIPLLISSTTSKTDWTLGTFLADLWCKDIDELHLPPACTWQAQQRHSNQFFSWMVITVDLCSILWSSNILSFEPWEEAQGFFPLGLHLQLSKLIKQVQICCSQWSDSDANERRTKQKVSTSLVLPISIQVQPWHSLPYYAT